MAEPAHLALIAETGHIPRQQFFCGLYQRLPARAVEAFYQCRLDLRVGLTANAAAFELRRDYLGVVDDELVTGLKQKREIGDHAVIQGATGLHDQHPRGIARASRAQREAISRKLEMEEVGAHDKSVIAGHSRPKDGYARASRRVVQ